MTMTVTVTVTVTVTEIVPDQRTRTCKVALSLTHTYNPIEYSEHVLRSSSQRELHDFLTSFFGRFTKQLINELANTVVNLYWLAKFYPYKEPPYLRNQYCKLLPHGSMGSIPVRACLHARS